MLIGSRSQPRPPKPQPHRLFRTPVKDCGRCGRSSPGRLAGLGRDGQLRLAERPAIPRGSGCGLCWGCGSADSGAGVPWQEHGAPPDAPRCCWRRAAAAAYLSALLSSVLAAAGVSRNRTSFHRGVAAPSAAGGGGAEARSRGLTSPPGLRGVGTAAPRLTCNGGGEAGLGVQLCPCAPAPLGPRLCSTLWPLSPLRDPAPRSAKL